MQPQRQRMKYSLTARTRLTAQHTTSLINTASSLYVFCLTDYSCLSLFLVMRSPQADRYILQDYTGISFYSCEYGLADLQPQPPKVTDCTNGVTDCLQVCPYVKGCTAVLYESRDINSNRTCAFINTRTNPLSCGYVDDLDQFGVQEGFGPS